MSSIINEACGEVTGVKKQAGIALARDAKTSAFAQRAIEELGQATLELRQHAATGSGLCRQGENASESF
ncbi:hypothetical protein ColLi_09257 [Colletotrichum liriopes]|uniref:Uncharacterized protein n=1 Tax=Colletotrichum liriopes TaxID=708192 RepID=A0AA37GTB7_9PEZI|nr:hypothetical protein ColLi_09257 [Colletotrichum liriopes]